MKKKKIFKVIIYYKCKLMESNCGNFDNFSEKCIKPLEVI